MSKGCKIGSLAAWRHLDILGQNHYECKINEFILRHVNPEFNVALIYCSLILLIFTFC